MKKSLCKWFLLLVSIGSVTGVGVAEAYARAVYDTHAYVCAPSTKNEDSGSNSGATAVGSGNLQTKVGDNWNNVTDFVNKAKEKGFSGAQIAVMVAVGARESGWNPKAVNSTSNATGYFQWVGDRLNKLKKLGDVYGTDNQINYLWQELGGGSYDIVFSGGAKAGGTSSGALGPVEQLKGWTSMMNNNQDEFKDLFYTWNNGYEGLSNVADKQQTNEELVLGYTQDAWNDDSLGLSSISGDESKLNSNFPTGGNGGAGSITGSTTDSKQDEGGCGDDSDSTGGNGTEGWILDKDYSYMDKGSMGAFPSYDVDDFNSGMDSTSGDHNGYDIGVTNEAGTLQYASYFHDWQLQGQPDTDGTATTLYAPFDMKTVAVTTSTSADAGGLGLSFQVTDESVLKKLGLDKLYIYLGHMPNSDSSKIKVGDTFKAGDKLNDIHVAGPSNGYPHVHLGVSDSQPVFWPHQKDVINPAYVFMYLQKVYADAPSGSFGKDNDLPSTGKPSAQKAIPSKNRSNSGAILPYSKIMKDGNNK